MKKWQKPMFSSLNVDSTYSSYPCGKGPAPGNNQCSKGSKLGCVYWSDTHHSTPGEGKSGKCNYNPDILDPGFSVPSGS